MPVQLIPVLSHLHTHVLQNAYRLLDVGSWSLISRAVAGSDNCRFPFVCVCV